MWCFVLSALLGFRGQITQDRATCAVDMRALVMHMPGFKASKQASKQASPVLLTCSVTYAWFVKDLMRSKQPFHV